MTDRNRAAKNRSGRVRASSLLIAVAAALLLGGSYFAWRQFKPVPMVHVAQAQMLADDRIFLAEGTVKGDRYEVGTSTGARIEWLGVKEGDQVKAGQVLFRLDSSDLALAIDQARAAIATADRDIARARSASRATSVTVKQRIQIAEAALRRSMAERDRALQGASPEQLARSRNASEEARLAYEEADEEAARSERLAEAGAGAKAESRAKRNIADMARQRWEAAKAALEELQSGPTAEDRRAADAAVEAAQTDLAAAKASMIETDSADRDIALAQARRNEAVTALRRAQAAMADLAVTAAAAGTVARVAVQQGGVALPVTVVIATRDDLHIEAEVGTEYSPFLKPGFPLQVTSSELGAIPFRARVESVAPESEQKPDTTVRSRIVRVRISVNDPDRKLLPGMDVDVQGTIKIPPLLSIPNEALVQREGQSKVLICADGNVRWQNVKAGPIGLSHTPILEGIKKGDQVVLSPGDLKTGAAVKVAE